MESANLLSLNDKEKCKISPSVGQAKNALSRPTLGAGKNTKLPAHLRQVETTKSHPPLQRGKRRLSQLQGRGACALPAQRARKSLHSPLSKGRELHAPGWGPFLVSPSSTCIKYSKAHFWHVCHFAELNYARLYLLKEPFTLDFGKSHLLQRVGTYLS
ncbi:hypothetical protein T05_13770 [Trichinella murrelli]|uniref:Uncharacterized protein n=1 Tax=Trichinella murrelli TaxID=144512 RepID=A0A0V0T7Q4_9BILA|nr:hypothetical protein T05_13770 [Trichinella murrelli]